MPPRRAVTVVSVIVHVLVVCCAIVAQLLAVGPLPVPHQPLSFDDVQLVRVRDIDLPPPPRSQPGPVQAVSAAAAPLVAPSAVTPETLLEPARRSAVHGDEVAGVEGGVPGGLGLVPGAAVAPPPPPPPPPRAPMRLHTGMEPPRKIVNVDPIYPIAARASRIEGVVILEAVLDEAGRVVSVRVLRPAPLLDQAAVDAVKQWRFTPTLLNGVPVPIVMTVTVNFTLK
ncbi:MAG TPA: energy transducer TonB [Vicinamibacterales bacterium]|jgi:protein TonB|nr:energy transducer TonB [Vicinamibacterales bacterium]